MFWTICLAGPLSGQTFSVTDPTRSPDGSTYYWKPLIQAGSYPPRYLAEPADDQQTGHREDDLVGSAANPGAFVRFGQIGGVDHLAFRLVENESYGANFKGQAGVGLDTDLDGSLDVVFTVIGKNHDNGINYQAPGSGLNVSPNTTTLGPVVNLAAFNGSNFHYQAIDSSVYPGWSQIGEEADAVLSFALPFATVNATLQALGETQISTTSMIRFVVYTATQSNANNQDLYGAYGSGSDSSASFASLSEPMDVNGRPIPEPSTWISLAILLGGGLLFRRFRGRIR